MIWFGTAIQSKTSTWSVVNLKNIWPWQSLNLRPWYGHLMLVRGYLFWQVSVDHNKDVQYQICTVSCRPRLHVPVKLLPVARVMIDQGNTFCCVWEKVDMAVVLYKRDKLVIKQTQRWIAKSRDVFLFYSIQPVFVWCLEECHIILFLL